MYCNKVKVSKTSDFLQSQQTQRNHLKFYTLCENDCWRALVIKMCHRNQKEETRAQSVNKDDSDLVNSKKMEIWARESL